MCARVCFSRQFYCVSAAIWQKIGLSRAFLFDYSPSNPGFLSCLRLSCRLKRREEKKKTIERLRDKEPTRGVHGLFLLLQWGKKAAVKVNYDDNYLHAAGRL